MRSLFVAVEDGSVTLPDIAVEDQSLTLADIAQAGQIAALKAKSAVSTSQNCVCGAVRPGPRVSLPASATWRVYTSARRRQIARTLGVDHDTIDRDIGGNTPPTNGNIRDTRSVDGGNPPPALTGRDAAVAINRREHSPC